MIIVLAIAVVGALHGLLVEGLQLPPIVVTLATFTGLQGLSLILRPSPDGAISYDFMDTVQATTGSVPYAFIVVVILGVALECVLLGKPTGRALRAIGSNPDAARLIGINRFKVGMLAFVASALLTAVGGLLLASQVGIGSATAGINYTLMGVTAVVLGGARISGGRGSFVSTLCAALFIQTIVSALPFLNLEAVWQYWIVGSATFVAAALFSWLRRGSAH